MKPRLSIVFDEPLSIEALEQKMNRIGFGWFQIFSIVLCGMYFFYLSAMVAAMPAVRKYPGMIIGSIVSSLVSPYIGRKSMIIFGLSLMSFTAYMSSSVTNTIPNYILVGHIGVGLGLASAMATVIESSPKKFQPLSLSLMLLMEIVGEVYVWIVGQIVSISGWCHRGMTTICSAQLSLEFISIPIFFALILSAIYLNESPVFVMDDCFNLNLILKRMKEWNRCDEEVSIKFVPSYHRLPSQPSLNIHCLIVYGFILFTIESFFAFFPKSPVDHLAVSVIGTVVLVGLVSVILSQGKGILTVLGVTLLMISLMSIFVTLVETKTFIKSWIIFSALRLLTFFSFTVLLWLILDPQVTSLVSVRYVSMIFSLGYGLCGLARYLVTLPVGAFEIVVACMFGIAGILVLVFPPTSAKTSACDDGVKFSKIPIIDYGSTVNESG
jgi:MFS family permease